MIGSKKTSKMRKKRKSFSLLVQTLKQNHFNDMALNQVFVLSSKMASIVYDTQQLVKQLDLLLTIPSVADNSVSTLRVELTEEIGHILCETSDVIKKDESQKKGLIRLIGLQIGNLVIELGIVRKDETMKLKISEVIDPNDGLIYRRAEKLRKSLEDFIHNNNIGIIAAPVDSPQSDFI